MSSNWFQIWRCRLRLWRRFAVSFSSNIWSGASRLISRTGDIFRAAMFRPTNEDRYMWTRLTYLWRKLVNSAKTALGSLPAAVGSLWRPSAPSQSMGFISAPLALGGFLAPFAGLIKVGAVVALFWGGYWYIHHRGYEKGYAAHAAEVAAAIDA